MFPRPILITNIFLAAFCLAASYAQAQETNPSTVSGTVLDSVNHQPVQRALVSTADERFAVLTDSEGHFEFKLPKLKPEQPGPWLNARKPGYLPSPNELSGVMASPGRELSITLIPEALIIGRVMTAANQPAQQITVQIYQLRTMEGMPQWAPGAAATTNSNGEFRFADLDAGTYKIFTHELLDDDPAVTVPNGPVFGYPPAYFPAERGFSSASPISVSAGQTFEADLVVTRQRYYEVSVPLANYETGNGVNVNVAPQAHGGPGYSLGFDPEKTAIAGLLPNGSYEVDVMSIGIRASVSGSATLNVSGGPSVARPMSLSAVPDIDLNVTEEFTSRTQPRSLTRLPGVTGPSGFVYATLQNVDSLSGFANAGANAVNASTLKIQGVAPGRYWLRVTTSKGYIASAASGGVDLLHEPLNVGQGSALPVDVVLRDDFAGISGSITGLPDSSAVQPSRAPAYLYCIPAGDGPAAYQELAISPDGKFESQQMAPGNYRLLAFSRPRNDLPYRDAEAMRNFEAKGTVVHLAPSQTTSVQVPLIGETE